jgi:diguanylate cyclase (GGDEF)-like protein/PAS domain S-box-containing protein
MTVTALRAIAEDLSGFGESWRRTAVLCESEEKFATMFRLAPEAMALVRAEDGAVLEVNRSFAECFGYRPDEMLGRSTLPHDLGLWIDVGQQQAWFAELEKWGELIDYETRLQRCDGSTGAFTLSGKFIDMRGEQCLIWTLRDISKQKEREEELSRIAYYDALTQLPNRLLLADRLRQAIAQSRRARTPLAVCYLDLDGFKAANDAFGHDAGDEILVEAARRLQLALRASDTVARLGGDEFVVLLCGVVNDQRCVMNALDRVLRSLSTPFALTCGQQTRISASIGVTIFPDDGATPETLVRHADQAMYVAKAAGRNRFHFFEPSLDP